jgi:type I restriction enzyme S subunit
MIPPGYKQTEVGVIPEEWEVKRLGDVVTFQRGYDLPHHCRKRGEIPIVTSAGVTDYHNASMADPPGVVTGRYGTIGEVFFITEPFWPLNTTLYVRDFHGNDRRFVYYLLQRFDFATFSGKSGVPGVNRNDLHVVTVTLPVEIPEQRAIATALSDVDALLAALDRLIAKQRDLKQAAMQQLLTGQTRLPGFEGEWEVKRLDEICWFQEGPGVRNTQFTNNGIKLLNGTNIYRGGLNLDTTTRFISEKEAYGPYSHFMADEGDIVLASSGITVERLHEKVAFVMRENLPFCMNTSTIRFKPNDGRLCPRFLFQFLVGDKFKLQIGGVATGSAQLNFGPSHVAKVEITLPPLPEQTAIATVLSDMDAELAALEQRRDKTRALKQGMMQELLTGRTRLVASPQKGGGA